MPKFQSSRSGPVKQWVSLTDFYSPYGFSETITPGFAEGLAKYGGNLSYHDPDIRGQIYGGDRQYYECVMMEPGYYVKEADYSIIREHADVLASFQGCNVLELCIGDGVKSAVLDKILKCRRKIINDSNGEEYLRKVTTKNLIATGFRERESIEYAPGNICTEAFWNAHQEIFASLCLEATNDSIDAAINTVVFEGGATWNNKNSEQQQFVLRKRRKHLPGSYFINSVDSTLHGDTLKECYATPSFQRWEATGFYAKCKKIGIEPDLRDVRASVDVRHGSGYTDIITSFKITGNGLARELARRRLIDPAKPRHVACDTIRKISERRIRAMYEEAGEKVLYILPYRSENPHIKHNFWITQAAA